MEVNYKFKIGEYDSDHNDHEIFKQAKSMYLAIIDLKNYFRCIDKYRDLTDDQYKLFEEINQTFYEALALNNLNTEL